MGKSAAAEPGRRVELTDKQREVLALIARGYTNAQIADQLGISLDGAKWHVREILGKLGVDSREEAADWWSAHNRGLPRIGRNLRSAATAIGLRWFAGAAAVAVLAGGAIAVYAALHNDDSGVTPAAPNPTSAETTSTPIPSETPNVAVPAVSPSATSTATAPTVIAGFSPRGLAFIRDGNLWVTETLGTPQQPVGERQVTTGGGLSFPVWSPSGRFITVSGFEKSWLIFGKGEIQSLDDCSNPTWSPVADELACVSPTGDITAFETEPGSPPMQTLVRRPADGSLVLAIGAWSPNGSQLIYEAARNAGERPSTFDLRLLDVAKGTSEPLITLTGTLSRPRWSQDYFAYALNPGNSPSLAADGLQVYALNVKTTGVVPLGTLLGYDDAIAFRPGSADVALVRDTGGREAWTGESLLFASLPGPLQPWANVVPGAIASPAWAADGTKLAYVAAPDAGQIGGGPAAKATLLLRRIYVQDADGGPAKKLDDDVRYRDEHPQFDNIGSILFARIPQDGMPSLWLWDS